MQAAWLTFATLGRREHPRLRVVFAMLAGGAPLLSERLAARGGPAVDLHDPLSFYDTSSYGPAAVEAMARRVGGEQLVYGSDRPVVEPTPTGREALLAENGAQLLERTGAIRRDQSGAYACPSAVRRAWGSPRERSSRRAYVSSAAAAQPLAPPERPEPRRGAVRAAVGRARAGARRGPRTRFLSPRSSSASPPRSPPTPARWRHLVRHEHDARVYEQIFSDERVNAWLICWSDRQDTGFHDHDESAGGIAVIAGRVREERLAVGSPPLVRRAVGGGVLQRPGERDPPRTARRRPSRRSRSTRTRRPSPAWAPTGSGPAARSSARRSPTSRSCAPRRGHPQIAAPQRKWGP